MIDLPIYNQTGQEVERVQIDEAKFGGEVNAALLKQAVVMYHSNKRQGTHRTLHRGEVEGSTRKIYRQKGTGNARMGPVRNPVRVGGGHAKQRLPKDWRKDMPKKMKQKATRHAILAKLQSNDVKVVDELKIEQAKTKEVAKVFKALGLDRSVLLALAGHDQTLERCSRNIDRTSVTTVAQLNAWDILKNRTLLLTRAGLQQLIA